MVNEIRATTSALCCAMGSRRVIFRFFCVFFDLSFVLLCIRFSYWHHPRPKALTAVSQAYCFRYDKSGIDSNMRLKLKAQKILLNISFFLLNMPVNSFSCLIN